MADVKWIRFIVGMFDGQSFKRIKRANIGGVPFRDKLTSVWFELLDLAAKCNNNGFLATTDEVAYKSFADIAIMLDRDEKEIELCIAFFVAEKMVELIDDCYCLSNWTKYQNNSGLQSIQEYNRIKQQESRERKKQALLSMTVNDSQELQSISTSTSNIIDNVKILSMFDTLWEIYPKKVGKEQAKKTFEHKLRGLTEQEAKDKANAIYTRLKQFISFWRENETEIKFVANMSTWLNAEIEDSKHFKGGKKV